MLALTNNSVASIDVTSCTTVDADERGSVDGDLWMSDLGHRYLELQSHAVQRRARIRRIFDH